MVAGHAQEIGDDPFLADAMFLINHPGWTRHDLLEAPDELVLTIRQYDSARAEAIQRERDRAAAASSRTSRRRR